MKRPAYLADKIAFQRARREARATHGQPCDCAYCLTVARADELLRERIRLERLLAGEPPF